MIGRILSCLLLFAAPAVAQTAPPSALGEILARGMLRVGLTGDYRPFSIRTAEGGFAGLDVDEAAALAKGMGVKLEIVPTAWPTMTADLLAHKFDVAMGGITITMERAKTAYFSAPVMQSGKTPIARCADQARFATLDGIDQPGVTAIVNPGGTNERFARENLHRAKVVVFPDNAVIFDEIVAGHADVMVTDSVETRLQQKLHPELCAVHPDEPFTHSSLGYMMAQDVPLQQFVDQFMAIEAQNGGRAARLAQWLP